MSFHHASVSDSREIPRAFTLLELLIVIAILGITALLVIPTAGVDRDIRLHTAARLLIADIEHAQSDSIGNGADPFVIVFNAIDNSYSLAHRSDPATPAVHPVSGAPLVTRFGEGRAAALAGVTIDALDLDGDGILGFSALGSLDQVGDASITLSNGAASLVIRIDSETGDVSIE